MVNLKTGERETTNVFHYTFVAAENNSVPKLLPGTYQEAIKILEGKRRREQGIKFRSDVLSRAPRS